MPPPTRTVRADTGPQAPDDVAPDDSPPAERVSDSVQPSLEATSLLAGLDDLPVDSILRTFHPAVASWFQRRFPEGPTEPQRRAWPHIRSGEDVLVASPTGTGKTLTGFLVAIDAAYRAQGAKTRAATPAGQGPGVIYVSPLGPWPSMSTKTCRCPWPASPTKPSAWDWPLPTSALPCGPVTRRRPNGQPCAGRHPICW